MNTRGRDRIIRRWQSAAEWVTRMSRKLNTVPAGPHWAGTVRRIAEDEAALAAPGLPRHVLHKGGRDTLAGRRHRRAAA